MALITASPYPSTIIPVYKWPTFSVTKSCNLYLSSSRANRTENRRLSQVGMTSCLLKPDTVRFFKSVAYFTRTDTLLVTCNNLWTDIGAAELCQNSLSFITSYHKLDANVMTSVMSVVMDFGLSIQFLLVSININYIGNVCAFFINWNCKKGSINDLCLWISILQLSGLTLLHFSSH